MKGWDARVTHPRYTIAQNIPNVYMKYPAQTSLLIDYATMVNRIRATEPSRNFAEAISAFKNIWEDLEIDPDFSDFPLEQQAELFRLSGYFLSHYGKAKNRIFFQERGKDLLTKAIEIYGKFNDFERVAEAQNALGMCYLFEGAVQEAEAIFEQTADDFLKDKLNLIYLQNRGNLLITKLILKKYDEGLKIVEEIIVPMEFCPDKKACYVFHEKAGNLFRRTKQFSHALVHYTKATNYAEQLANPIFLSSGKNNLAILYSLIGNFVLAHQNIDEAIQLVEEDSQFGWLSNFLDTKATIYFDEGNISGALETVNEAISLLQKGEDAQGLTEAMWNKCKFLLYLNRKREAIKLFAELSSIASDKMGAFAIDNLSEEFAELIHVKQGGSLEEETKRFRRIEVITAIRNAKYEMKTAAESLKISHSDLTRIIDQEFPELYEEINLERFAAINHEPEKITQNYQQNISELFFENSTSNLSGQFLTFYFDSEVSHEILGVPQDIVMAIEPIDKIKLDEFTLVYNKLTGIYCFGKVHFDSLLDLYFLLEKDAPLPLSFDEVKLIGKAVGYFPFTEIDNEKLEFKPLPF